VPKKTSHIVNHYDVSSLSSSSSVSSLFRHPEVEGQIEGSPNKNTLLMEPGGVGGVGGVGETTDNTNDTDNTAKIRNAEKRKQSKRAMICSLLTLLLSIPALIGA